MGQADHTIDPAPRASGEPGSRVEPDRSTVRAVGRRRYGLPRNVVEVSDHPRDLPGPGQIQVRVEAAGINRGDTFEVAGTPQVTRLMWGLRRPRRQRLGWDLAGTVVAAGPDVATVGPGTRVFGTGSGTFGDEVVVDADAVAVLPDGIDAVDAAAVPTAGMTALQGLRDAAGLTAGQSVLVNGASGGVGTFAVQVARWMGAEVTGICSTRNLDLVADLGAETVVDYTTTDPVDLGRTWDVVFDNVGNHPWPHLRRLLAPRGVLVPNSGEGGRLLGPLPRMAGTLLRSLVESRRVGLFVQTASIDDLDLLARLIDQGAIRPVIERVLPLADAAEALAHVADGHTVGKVVLVP